MAATKVKRRSKVKATEKCGVIRKGRPPCGQPAGAGTPNSKGPCWLHMGAMPTVAKRYARAEAVEKARHLLTDEMPDDPFEAMLASVRVSSAIVAYHRLKIESLDVVTRADEEGLEAANRQRQQIAEGVVRAGVAERTVQIVERWAETLTMAFEAAAMAMKLDAKTRAVGVKAFAEALRPLEEGEQLALDPGPR
jgi:hypothetical protein